MQSYLVIYNLLAMPFYNWSEYDVWSGCLVTKGSSYDMIVVYH